MFSSSPFINTYYAHTYHEVIYTFLSLTVFHQHFSVLNILKTYIMTNSFVCAHVCTCVFASIFYVLPTT